MGLKSRIRRKPWAVELVKSLLFQLSMGLLSTFYALRPEGSYFRVAAFLVGASMFLWADATRRGYSPRFLQPAVALASLGALIQLQLADNDAARLQCANRLVLHYSAALAAGAVFLWGLRRWFCFWTSRRGLLALSAVSAAAYLAAVVAGQAIGGARSWILNGSLQPSELVKPLFCVVCGALLGRKSDTVSGTRGASGQGDDLAGFYSGLYADIRRLGPLALLFLLHAGLLVLQGELGTLLIYAMTFTGAVCAFLPPLQTAKLFAALGSLGAMGAGACAAILSLSGAGRAHLYYQIDKVTARLDMYWGSGDNYQLALAQKAIARGSWLGGFSQGYIPMASTDMVLAAIAQTFGLAMLLLTMLLFVLLLSRALVLVRRAESGRAGAAATVATMLLASQAFVVLGGVIGVIPLTGIPFPLVARGGSACVSVAMLLALVLLPAAEPRWQDMEQAVEARDRALNEQKEARWLHVKAKIKPYRQMLCTYGRVLRSGDGGVVSAFRTGRDRVGSDLGVEEEPVRARRNLRRLWIGACLKQITAALGRRFRG